MYVYVAILSTQTRPALEHDASDLASASVSKLTAWQGCHKGAVQRPYSRMPQRVWWCKVHNVTSLSQKLLTSVHLACAGHRTTVSAAAWRTASFQPPPARSRQWEALDTALELLIAKSLEVHQHQGGAVVKPGTHDLGPDTNLGVT